MALRMVRCGCENSVCPHTNDTCPELAFAEPNGTASEPVMAFIGPVCTMCARVMGEVHPEWITAPYGTFDNWADES